jgi:hypothetical protein
MSRALLSLLLSPVLVSLLFGAGAALVLPIALLATGVLATPFFFLFRSLGWLRWWHAVTVGFVCGVVFSAAFDLGTSWARVDAFGAQDAIWFGGVGAFIALVFWWLGVFRNPAFPTVPVSVPWSMFLMVPIAAAGFFLHRSLDPTFFQGRIIAMKGDAPARQVTVRLSSGADVATHLLDDSRPTSVMMDQCWHLMKHWSLSEFGQVYSLEAPFGGGVNDC